VKKASRAGEESVETRSFENTVGDFAIAASYGSERGGRSAVASAQANHKQAIEIS